MQLVVMGAFMREILLLSKQQSSGVEMLMLGRLSASKYEIFSGSRAAFVGTWCLTPLKLGRRLKGAGASQRQTGIAAC